MALIFSSVTFTLPSSPVPFCPLLLPFAFNIKSDLAERGLYCALRQIKGISQSLGWEKHQPEGRTHPLGLRPQAGLPARSSPAAHHPPRAGSQGRFFIRSARGARLGAQPSRLPADPAIFFKVSALQTSGAAWGGSETDNPLLSAPFYLWSY